MGKWMDCSRGSDPAPESAMVGVVMVPFGVDGAEERDFKGQNRIMGHG
jgi:hypothetical protein